MNEFPTMSEVYAHAFAARATEAAKAVETSPLGPMRCVVCRRKMEPCEPGSVPLDHDVLCGEFLDESPICSSACAEVIFSEDIMDEWKDPASFRNLDEMEYEIRLQIARAQKLSKKTVFPWEEVFWAFFSFFGRWDITKWVCEAAASKGVHIQNAVLDFRNMPAPSGFTRSYFDDWPRSLLMRMRDLAKLLIADARREEHRRTFRTDGNG